MTQCPRCAADLTAGIRFCPNCGTAVGEPTPVSEDITVPGNPIGSDPSISFDSGRFPTGTILANRYRIVGLLGEGGMGEVYRADDLTLGRVVALKFLKGALLEDPARKQRFLDEIRMALRVTHPNVCRVHDIGESDGVPYLSMEFIDGEDLSVLLRRIGRLPEEKAIEIARQLCAGLAAAHAQGVLHRDLKPANVMLDGRGQVKITDFGLAGIDGPGEGAGFGGGTLAYMSPEQRQRQPATTASDIYSLGLVLYELFSGQRAFDGKSADELSRQVVSSTPSSLTSHISNIDPVVERVIFRCLEPDPQDRPQSALAVAAALPGGNPLAEALAAGETPSPQMVAGAGDDGGLNPGTAVVTLVGFFVLLVLTLLVSSELSLLGYVEEKLSPDVLENRAQEFLRTMGADLDVGDEAGGFAVADKYLKWIEESSDAPDRWEVLRSGQPAPLRYWHRHSPEELLNLTPNWVVSYTRPPILEPGMRNVVLDLSGRLVEYRRVPPKFDSEIPVAARGTDWDALFRAAGLDPELFSELEPAWIPPSFADRRYAWTGRYPHSPDLELRVEAASYRGAPVYFRLMDPGAKIESSGPVPQLTENPALAIFTLCLLIMIFGGLVWLAFVNLRSGRGDRRGGLLLGGLMLVVSIVAWIFMGHHLSVTLELIQFTALRLPRMVFDAALIWLAYIAVEPYARKIWPQTLISWNRLLAGRWLDPMVGRDVLIGCLFGLGWQCAFLVVQLLPVWEGGPAPTPTLVSKDALVGPGSLIGTGLSISLGSLLNALVFPLLFVVLRLILRKNGLALGALLLLLSAQGVLFGASGILGLSLTVLGSAAIIYLFARVGLLALAAGFLASNMATVLFSTTDILEWYGAPTTAALVVVTLLALYGFWVSLAGRRVFRDTIFED